MATIQTELCVFNTSSICFQHHPACCADDLRNVTYLLGTLLGRRLAIAGLQGSKLAADQLETLLQAALPRRLLWCVDPLQTNYPGTSLTVRTFSRPCASRVLGLQL